MQFTLVSPAKLHFLQRGAGLRYLAEGQILVGQGLPTVKLLTNIRKVDVGGQRFGLDGAEPWFDWLHTTGDLFPRFSTIHSPVLLHLQVSRDLRADVIPLATRS